MAVGPVDKDFYRSERFGAEVSFVAVAVLGDGRFGRQEPAITGRSLSGHNPFHTTNRAMYEYLYPIRKS